MGSDGRTEAKIVSVAETGTTDLSTVFLGRGQGRGQGTALSSRKRPTHPGSESALEPRPYRVSAGNSRQGGHFRSQEDRAGGRAWGQLQGSGRPSWAKGAG